jgi:hypothetical protein
MKRGMWPRQKGLLNKNLMGRKLPKGEDHKGSKLTWKKVDIIRNSPMSQRALAKRFKVHQHTIWCILNYITWTVSKDFKYNPPKEK